VAHPGEKPAGATSDVTEIAATVESLDAARHIVKVKGPEGYIRILEVGSDVKKGTNWWSATLRKSPTPSRNSRRSLAGRMKGTLNGRGSS
jgi:hypothetical protein